MDTSFRKSEVKCQVSGVKCPPLRGGFTLFETIIVIGLIAVLTFAVAPYIGGVTWNNYTEGTALNIVSDLRAAQAKAMAGIDGSTPLDGVGDIWGICFRNFPSDYYEIFTIDTSCPTEGYLDSDGSINATPSANIKSSVFLPGGITFSDPASGETRAIIFDKTYGTNFNGSDDTIQIISNLSRSIVVVTAGGQTSIAEFSVTTSNARNITISAATLNAKSNPAASQSTGWFRYWTTGAQPTTCADSGGTRVPAAVGTGNNLGSGAAAVSFSQNISGLTSNTSYHYCAIAKRDSSTEPIFGALVQFTTASGLPPPPPPVPMPPSVRGQWHFDNADHDNPSGKTRDTSGRGNDGTLGSTTGSESSDPTNSATSKFGDRSYSFDSGDYITLPNTSDFELQYDLLDFTIGSSSMSAWVKTARTSAAVIMGSGTRDAAGGWSMGMNQDGTPGVVRCSVQSTSGQNSVAVGTTEVNNNVWHHIVCIRDRASDTVKLYVDGSLEKSITDISTESTGGCTPRIGGDNTGSACPNLGGGAPRPLYDGFIDEAYIFDGVLSASQVSNLYNTNTPP